MGMFYLPSAEHGKFERNEIEGKQKQRSSWFLEFKRLLCICAMTFNGYKDLIEAGDTVILYINFNVMYPIKVEETKRTKSNQIVENVFQTSFGAVKVKDLIGKKFGTKVRLSRGYAYALHPTPELWTKTLPHRTQILYATDISMVVLQLGLKPGSVVVESGTGSGSLSHSLARSIAPHGRLYTFDFHQLRSETARKEFQDHGIGDIVTAAQRDVCKDGFDLKDVADAVFLDLPHPWEAVGHAQKALKKMGGRICSFSPCIEQVQKCSEALRQKGFKEISTMECLLREFQVRKITVPVFDAERESKEILENKKRKLDHEITKDCDEMEKHVDITEKTKTAEEETLKGDRKSDEEASFLTGIPLLNMPGHTGYLTFATLPKKLP